MDTRASTVDLYERVKRGLIGLGYKGHLLRENYQFADFLSSTYRVRTIPLAAFAEDPPSYQNACFGVVTANGARGAPLIADYKSLGAPQVFEILEDTLRRWKVISGGDCIPLEDVPAEHIDSFFELHKQDWSPTQLGRARFFRPQNIGVQLDLFDLRLLPFLDYQIRHKLDALLSETILLGIETYNRSQPFKEEDSAPLFRLVFRLIASKLLADREQSGDWLSEDTDNVIAHVAERYFKAHAGGPVLEDRNTRQTIWERIRKSFHFQNVSVDTLAYVYENTAVTQPARKLLGVHGTPPAIAEYVMRHLPIETLPIEDRRIFEPFAGQAAFLVAAMRRLRELLPADFTPEKRHAYLVERLSGIEIDAFSLEVAFLSLLLADYPNPDGWRLIQGDVFVDSRVEQELRSADVVLCNPPFEDFKGPGKRPLYNTIGSLHKPVAILERTIASGPRMLGFVLPRVFVAGSGYRTIRRSLADTFGTIEVMALPDQVFEHSEAESVLLIASGRPTGKLHLITGEVYKKDLDNFYQQYEVSTRSEEVIKVRPNAFDESMWLPLLGEVWEATANLPKLMDVAEVHRGIEYDPPLGLNRLKYVSSVPRPGFAPGVDRARRVEPFVVSSYVYLNNSEEFMRGGAYRFPWNRPKVIVNATRRSRGPWRLTAAVDTEGLICYENLHGIWPNSDIGPEVLTAILNGPVANAFIATHEGQRSVRVRTLKSIPIPHLSVGQSQTIVKLVTDYARTRSAWVSGFNVDEAYRDACRQLAKEIDGVVLQAYDLAPRVERLLLDYFRGYARPVPFEFKEYFPSEFKPFIPWMMYISQDYAESSVAATVKRLPIITDPRVAEALEALADLS